MKANPSSVDLQAWARSLVTDRAETLDPVEPFRGPVVERQPRIYVVAPRNEDAQRWLRSNRIAPRRSRVLLRPNTCDGIHFHDDDVLVFLPYWWVKPWSDDLAAVIKAALAVQQPCVVVA